jgi:hypothetical protein
MMYNIGDAATLNVYIMTCVPHRRPSVRFLPCALFFRKYSFNSTTSSLGTAAIPSAYYRAPKSDGVMLRHATVAGGARAHYNKGRTLTHEVGHWLGLFHTFEVCTHTAAATLFFILFILKFWTLMVCLGDRAGATAASATMSRIRRLRPRARTGVPWGGTAVPEAAPIS